MNNVTITFVHKCKEFANNQLYELKYFNDEWLIVEDLDDDIFEVLSNVKYCPYCGKELGKPSLKGCMYDGC
jgi:hypothetical protein